MADAAESEQSQINAQLPSGTDANVSLYWCYSCNKRVTVETLADLSDVVCGECRNGFVESIPAPDATEDNALRSQLAQVLRVIAQTALEDDASHDSPPPQPDPLGEDYLRFEFGGWDEYRGDEDDEDDDEENPGGVVHGEGAGADNRERYAENGSDAEDGVGNEVIGARDEDVDEEEYEEEEVRRRRREILRLRLRDYTNRAASRRNRILDWAEILMGLEDHQSDLRFQPSESEMYVGNPGDYVDAAGYEALLQQFAESGGGGRGAPPASKGVVEGLQSIEIGKEDEAITCAICKDLMNVGELAKKLPCEHLYHGHCIVPWLSSRNSCPVCRFELSTDDPEYEEERRKRVVVAGLKAATSISSASGGSRPPPNTGS